ncbi:hypothetical protein K525DRAFT_271471 [Schizophyllum commune Loenen D]|nr:hypothetical protein K525DRAFT_271471 [Schizophyllum commune Loenen D]
MAQIVPAPNPAANNAPGPVTLPASMVAQKAAIDYVIWLSKKVHRPESGITGDHLLAGLEHMYHVLCGRDDRPVERSEILPQYIGAPVYAQMLITSILKEIEDYTATYRKPIADLKKTLLDCHTRSAKTFNHLSGDLYPYEEVPFKDGQKPSDLNYPPITSVPSIIALTRAERSNYLKGWGLPATGTSNDQIERVKSAIGL